MEAIYSLLEQASILQIVIIGLVLLLVWFLPAIVALFLNRKHAKYIALACIPAGLSFIAWGGVMVWAVTGKVFERHRGKVETAEL
jgi:hypothetical protein